MKNGFYLSTYVHIGELHHLTSLMARHEQNISLWCKSSDEIKLIHYWELERVTGIKKHGTSFYNVGHAVHVINQLLGPYNLTIKDMEQVWGTPELQTCDDYHSIKEYPDVSYHSIAHLFSAIMLDSDKFYNDNIIGLAIDGSPDRVVDEYAGEKDFYSGCVVKNGNVDVFPVFSPGPLWMFAKNKCKLLEGTLMALGSASTSSLLSSTTDTIYLRGSEYSNASTYRPLANLMDGIWGLTSSDKGVKFNGFDDKFTIEENRISMFVKELHKMSLKIMETNVDNIIKKHSINPEDTYLALAGGYALNCPTNSYLMQKYKFKGFIAPPCVSDCGMSLGIALYAFYKKMKKINFRFDGAYYGDKDINLYSTTEKTSNSKFIESIQELSSVQLVGDIKESPIVWFDGSAELGPRALGNRSILADPRFELSKDQLNNIKDRQWWRPVAPIILEEDLDDWFEDAFESPFMLHTFKIRENKKHLIPAVSHLDDSARVQTLNPDTNPLLYNAIKCFKLKTGIPMLCNTSLNDKGEPIINTIDEAINFILRKNIKVAYINGKRVKFHYHNEYLSKKPYKRPVEMDILNSEEKEGLLKKYNPFDLENKYIDSRYRDPELRHMYDLTDYGDVRKLVLILDEYHSKLNR